MAIRISSKAAADIIGIPHENLLAYVNDVLSQNKPLNFKIKTGEYDMPVNDAYRVAMATGQDAVDRITKYWNDELTVVRDIRMTAEEQFDGITKEELEEMTKNIRFLCSSGSGETLAYIYKLYKEKYSKETLIKVCKALVKDGKLNQIRKLRYKTLFG